jgi:hypothetical protein
MVNETWIQLEFDFGIMETIDQSLNMRNKHKLSYCQQSPTRYVRDSLVHGSRAREHATLLTILICIKKCIMNL